jgi:Na+/proline symporter
MTLSGLDWAIIAGYLIFALAVGLYFQRRAGSDISEYFLSGRSLPWWLAGTSMVATTFAADTPLAITGIVATSGIAGNWMWWNLALSHMVATLFFARLWRRAGVLTDLELVDLRYSGRPAILLRRFRACWEGIVINSIIQGWVILAMVKLMGVLFDLDALAATLGVDAWIDGRWLGIIVCLVVALVYTVLSGFWGVVMTDFIQFGMAMIGAVMLAVYAWRDIGGAEPLRRRLTDLYGAETESLLSFFPTGGTYSLPLMSFVAFLSVNWWASRQIDGGNFLTQRMLATRDEHHSFLAALWFTIAHYVIRPWPWILVALVSLVVFPGLEDPELGYPKMILEYLPSGLLGLMIASFLAAFMSTIDSHLNWGSSLLVNDLYKPWTESRHSARHYVRVARALGVLLMACGGVVAYLMTSVVGGWRLFYGLTAGVGGVYVARWMWWRISAWSEISAWLGSAVCYLALQQVWPQLGFGWHLIITTGFSTLCWVTVTFLTPPTAADKLDSFYRKVRPGSPWWKPVAARVEVEVESLGRSDLLAWVAGVVLVFASLFGFGRLLLDGMVHSLPYWTVSLIAAWTVRRCLDRSRRSTG